MRCKFIMTRGRRKGEKCGGGARSTNSKGERCCYQHSKAVDNSGIHQLLRDDEVVNPDRGVNPEAVSVRAETFGGTSGDTSRFSVWLITINSQKDFRTMTDSHRARFRDWCDFLLAPESLGILEYIEDTRSADGSGRPHGNIVSVSSDYHFEAGEKAGKLHCHCVLRMEHNGHNQFKPNKLRAVSHEVFGYNLHYSVYARSDPAASMTRYIQKKQRATGEEITL